MFVCFLAFKKDKESKANMIKSTDGDKLNSVIESLH